MHLVEQHGGDARQFGVGLNPRDEDAFGQHRHPRVSRTAAVHAGGVADRLTDRLARHRRHPLRRRTRGKAARAEQQDFDPRHPRLAEQRGGDGGGFARARRGDEHRVCAGAQGGEQFGEDGMDGEVGHWFRLTRSHRGR